MKCIEISRKTQSTVTVHSVCGFRTFSLHICFMKCTTISSHGIGTELPHARTENKKESEWEMPLPLPWLKKHSVFRSPNGVGCHMISTQSEEDCLRVWAIPMMLEPCTCLHAIENIDMLNTTDKESETRKPPWFKDDFKSNFFNQHF